MVDEEKLRGGVLGLYWALEVQNGGFGGRV